MLLQEAPALDAAAQPVAPTGVGGDADARIAALQQELRTKDEYLQTSHEELQSTNEELATVNSELQAKVLDLSRANNDMNNLLTGKSYMMRIQPYCTLESVIEGAVQDLNGRTIAWNPGAARMYGWSEAETLMPYSTQRLTRTGATLPVQITATALINEAGQVHAIATTERLQAATKNVENCQPTADTVCRFNSSSVLPLSAFYSTQPLAERPISAMAAWLGLGKSTTNSSVVYSPTPSAPEPLQ